jgi:hypothetical protein
MPLQCHIPPLRHEWPSPSMLQPYNEKIVIAQALTPTPANDTSIHHVAIIALLCNCGYCSAALLAPPFYKLSTYAVELSNLSSGHHLTALPTADIQ